jgi:hypothetical protein
MCGETKVEGFKPLMKRKASLKSRVLRLMGRNIGFQLSEFSQDKKLGISEVHVHRDLTKELRNAIVEAEQGKALGIAEFQKHRFNR